MSIYTCPMYPEIQRDKPGNYPVYGMNLVFQSDDGALDGVGRARRLARATMRNIRQNRFFALIYNTAGVPIAAGPLFPLFRILISPMFTASSISRVLNSLRLRSARV